VGAVISFFQNGNFLENFVYIWRMKKIASSPTLVDLEKMLNQYFYSNTYQIFPDLTVTNSKGIYDKVIVKKEKSRYVLYQK
jgi:hypothetical protein